jgi:Mg-chelatase subunit ChlD
VLALRRVAALGGALAVVVACGSRTGLPVGERRATVSSKFCARASYESGHSDVTLIVLLDRSYSMGYDSKWDDATAAVGALVRDPEAAGMGFGLQYFPSRRDECSLASYELPAVRVGVLPSNADAVIDSLSQVQPEGITPTWLALRGAIAHARALRLSEPARDVVVVIVTDGDPEGCNEYPNSTRGVVDLAREAATSSPEVRTYLIGFSSGFVERMDQIAAAGGSGNAVVIGTDPTTAQTLVTTLKSLRDDDRACRYAVPSVAAEATAYDLGVVLTPSPGGAPVTVPLVGSASKCGGGPGFFVDDPSKPARITLCAASCALAHSDARSRVDVSVGCGGGAPDAGVIDFDAGPCAGVVDVYCKTSCESDARVDAVCDAGKWVCPSGSVSTTACTVCPAVPHGCCKPDGTLGEASCVAGAWVCPPGASLFGAPGCSPPAVCAPTMPCASTSLCRTADHACGGRALGTCVPRQTGCAPGPAACGCDGHIYPSECDANRAGVDVALEGCPSPPADRFACGPYFCRRADEICKRALDLEKTVAQSTYACVSASGCTTGCGCGLCGSCTRPSCAETCTNDGSGGRQVTCTSF